MGLPAASQLSPRLQEILSQGKLSIVPPAPAEASSTPSQSLNNQEEKALLEAMRAIREYAQSLRQTGEPAPKCFVSSAGIIDNELIVKCAREAGVDVIGNIKDPNKKDKREDQAAVT